jgi:mannose-6-phosphate isomerase-like protein (cupin superfamily)
MAMSTEASAPAQPVLDAQVFKYVQPEFETGRKVVTLGKTDRMVAMIAVIKSGGETNLHAHPHFDGFWMVVGGRVRFYNDVNNVLGEFGKYEGVLIPKGYKYWFEAIGDEPLEMVQIEAADLAFSDVKKRRIDYTPKTRKDSDLRIDGVVRTVPNRA